MVKITNGMTIVEVTEGAFNNIYKNLGFFELEKQSKKEVEDTVADDDISEDETDSENTDEDNLVKSLEEKPLSKWSKNEVKEYVKIKGIDISGTKNVNEAKDIIKEYLK